MAKSTTGSGWTVAPNAVLRARGSRTSAHKAESGCPRRATLQNLAQTADSSRVPKGITANTAILICWLILLIVTLVALELHIRSLTRHSFLSRPQALSTALGDAVTAPPGAACSCRGFDRSLGTYLRLKSDTASARRSPFRRSTSESFIAARSGMILGLREHVFAPGAHS